MHAVIQSIASDEVDIDSFKPDDPSFFSLNIHVRIGSDKTPGSADNFELLVCTPKWLCQTVGEPRWGRHMLIVQHYDRTTIENLIYDYADKCRGREWCNLAEKLARNFAWEFEDYQGT